MDPSQTPSPTITSSSTSSTTNPRNSSSPAKVPTIHSISTDPQLPSTNHPLPQLAPPRPNNETIEKATSDIDRIAEVRPMVELTNEVYELSIKASKPDATITCKVVALQHRVMLLGARLSKLAIATKALERNKMQNLTEEQRMQINIEETSVGVCFRVVRRECEIIFDLIGKAHSGDDPALSFPLNIMTGHDEGVWDALFKQQAADQARGSGDETGEDL